jgi:hypothetical protein
LDIFRAQALGTGLGAHALQELGVTIESGARLVFESLRGHLLVKEPSFMRSMLLVSESAPTPSNLST